MKRGLLCTLIILTAVEGSFAQFISAVGGGNRKAAKRPDPDKPTVIRMSVQPANEPRPALRYQLLPGILDQTAGNAATLYPLVHNCVPEEVTDELYEKIKAWIKTPLKELPRDEIRQMLYRYRTALRQIELASRREKCDWGLPIRTEGYNVMLPSLSKYRRLAKVLAVKARLEIAEGKHDQAVRTLNTGYAMGKHMAEGPLLISDLVGISITSLMNEQVQELIQSEGSPNMYWALTRLPRPMIGLREAMDYESSSLYMAYPQLRGLADKQLSPEQWQAMTGELLKLRAMVGGESVGTSGKLLMTAWAIKLYPEAKRHLISAGRTREQVEAMPVQQVIAIHCLEQYDYWKGELFKWNSLPYWQAREGLQKATSAFRKWQKKNRGNPATALLGSFSKAFFYQAKLDRRIAALRCIEAVRMFAARNEGRLPKRLDELTDTPVPIDPVTGKNFGYKAEGNTFTLDAPAPPGMLAKDGERYVVTIRK
ncbi:MAG: hypothetical protein KAV00_05355 [Phycisphaerae bacterium]|nr:hypothetical protein [Phycisphaerae bacterium]